MKIRKLRSTINSVTSIWYSKVRLNTWSCKLSLCRQSYMTSNKALVSSGFLHSSSLPDTSNTVRQVPCCNNLVIVYHLCPIPHTMHLYIPPYSFGQKKKNSHSSINKSSIGTSVLGVVIGDGLFFRRRLCNSIYRLLIIASVLFGKYCTM